MPFNSFAFAVFFVVIYIVYWSLQRSSLKIQNAMLLVASYFFYGWWDWRFLGLIAISSAVDYFVGLRLDSAVGEFRRRSLLLFSLAANLGILGYFKYYGFFVESFVDAMQSIGIHANVRVLSIVLPVGISFYTFQSLSYTIDVFRKQVQPTRDFVAFFAYVSFFPQLVAGPIERAAHLLPQFQTRRTFDAHLAKDGLRQILWGLFKKVVIADNLAPMVDGIFANYQQYGGLTLFLGVLYFAIQIYCDFSGYSDIAIGTARLFGFDLMRNFAYPYFSRNIVDFWRRWHISLSTWFRDYVYIPLGGSRTGTRLRHLTNVMITFVLSGIWHGADWTFVAWGALHGFYYVVFLLLGNPKRQYDMVARGRLFPSPKEAIQITITFALVLVAWIFFRADSIEHALSYIHQMSFSSSLAPAPLKGLAFVAFVMAIEWFQRDKPHALHIGEYPAWIRWAAYYGLIGLMLLYGKTGHVPFIYFQF